MAASVVSIDHSTLSCSCPNCGTAVPVAQSQFGLEARRRITDLEAQVTLFSAKATAAVDKLADYEDEIRRLKTASAPPDTNTSYPPPPLPNTEAAPRPSSSDTSRAPPPPAPPSVQNRFSSFLASRRTTSAPSTAISPPPLPPGLPPTPRETDLQAALAREQTLRQQAEGKLTQVNGELEDLSAQLFQQANEMVAAERRARAKLEERVRVLELRDGEKRVRLERLERAVVRVERVRGLLKEGGGKENVG